MAARKLDPTVKWERAFQRKLKTLENKAGPLGQDCFKQFGIPTATKLFSDHFAECIKNMKAEIRRLEQEAKIQAKVDATYRKYHWLWEHREEITPEEFRVHARDLGNLIHDLPARWTGYRTQACIDSSEKPCKEHFHPRQWAGNVIMSYIYHNEGITKETLRAFFDVFRQVHHTTEKENQLLRPSQEAAAYSGWEEPYAEVCSELVQISDNGPIRKVEEIWDVKLVAI